MRTSRQVFPRFVDSNVFGRLVVQRKEDMLGSGTYGVVYQAHSAENPNVKKAVKFLNPETVLENEGIPATTLREVNAMKSINCCNVMSLEDVVYKNGPEGFVMIMDLMKGHMGDAIKEMTARYLANRECYATSILADTGKRDFQERLPTVTLPTPYVRQAKIIAWQLLNGAAACHAHGVIHRDIKPANILWSTDNFMKIGDFGLARFQRGERTLNFSVPQQTGEICTLQYRAPEVLLGDQNYGLRVDDWSIGCCIAEMFHLKFDPNRGGLMGTPVFNGTSELSNLLIIFDLCGTPSSDGYLRSTPWWTEDFPQYRRRLREALPLLDDLGYDLVSKLLTLEPCERYSCRQLLDHGWFSDVATEGLLNRYTPWDAAIKNQLARMRSIIDHSHVSPSPYWEVNNSGNNSNRGGKSLSRLQKGRSVQNIKGQDENVAPQSSDHKSAVGTMKPVMSTGNNNGAVVVTGSTSGIGTMVANRAPNKRPREATNNTISSSDGSHGELKRLRSNRQQLISNKSHPYDEANTIQNAFKPSTNSTRGLPSNMIHKRNNITQRIQNKVKQGTLSNNSNVTNNNSTTNASSSTTAALTGVKQNRLIDDYMK